MNRSMLLSTLCLILSPLLVSQQPQRAASSFAAWPAPDSKQAADLPQSSVGSARNLAIKNARTIYINSETDFLTVGTLDRALMQQEDWEKLGLSIVSEPRNADLEIDVNRVIFTHIHTFVVTDKASSIVLASGEVRAFDGVVASGPMAEEIVKILAAVRRPRQPTSGE
jgi:hypothetical protein